MLRKKKVSMGLKSSKLMKKNLFKRGSLFTAALVLCAALFIQPGNLRAEQCSDLPTIAAGRQHTVSLKEDGTVVAVGNNWSGQLNVSGWTGIKAVAAGFRHTVGLKEDGTVVAVGQTNVSGWTGIKAVFAGWKHTVGLKEDGTAVAVGWNGYGQTDVSGWTGITAIAAGIYHTVGLKEDGTVVAAGTNNYGQNNVSGWTGIKAVAAGRWHTVGLKEDSTVVAAGTNNYSQMNVSDWSGITAVAAGYYHTVGLKEDGTVVAIGSTYYGHLNVSNWTDIRQPCGGSPSTPDDVATVVEEMLADGLISGNGNSASALTNELIQMLADAQDALDTLPEPQNYWDAIYWLNEFITKVSDQTCDPDQGNGQCNGKKISTEAGAELTGYAEGLIEQYSVLATGN